MFGGGGTIPYEALNLGLESYSIDSNELSVFIQKSNLQYLNDVEVDNLTRVLEQSGKNVLDRLRELTASIFPNRLRSDGRETTNYLWTYAFKCEKCNELFSLSKRYWLSKKKNRNLFIKVKEVRKKGSEFSIHTAPEIPDQTNWVKRLNKVRCPHCNHETTDITIKKAKEVPVVEIVKEKKGKSFIIANGLDEQTLKNIMALEKKSLKILGADLPKSKLPRWSGIVNPALYGIETHSDIFSPRQRATCLALLRSLKEEYDAIVHEKGEMTAKYTISALSGLIDQLVDWNCRMSMWISQNEQVGRAFCGPGISMYWDFCETDPVANGPSNLNGKLKRIIEGVRSIKKLPNKGHVDHVKAQSLPYKDKMFDAIVTDPPYYDNIFYTVLADNFYAWKRILLKHIDPELFKNENTDFSDELVASTKRSGNSTQAHKDYCSN